MVKWANWLLRSALAATRCSQIEVYWEEVELDEISYHECCLRIQAAAVINDKNYILSIVLTAMDQKLQKS